MIVSVYMSLATPPPFSVFYQWKTDKCKTEALQSFDGTDIQGQMHPKEWSTTQEIPHSGDVGTGCVGMCLCRKHVTAQEAQ